MLARLPASILGTSLVGGSQHAADNKDDEQDERDKQDDEQGEQEGRSAYASQGEDACLRDARLRDARLRDARLRDARLRDAYEMHTCEMHVCEMHDCRLCLRDEVLEEKWQVIDHCDVVPAMQFNNGLTPPSYTCLNHFVKLLQRA